MESGDRKQEAPRTRAQNGKEAHAAEGDASADIGQEEMNSETIVTPDGRLRPSSAGRARGRHTDRFLSFAPTQRLVRDSGGMWISRRPNNRASIENAPGPRSAKAT